MCFVGSGNAGAPPGDEAAQKGDGETVRKAIGQCGCI
jgi:hypothetical protein